MTPEQLRHVAEIKDGAGKAGDATWFRLAASALEARDAEVDRLRAGVQEAWCAAARIREEKGAEIGRLRAALTKRLGIEEECAWAIDALQGLTHDLSCERAAKERAEDERDTARKTIDALRAELANGSMHLLAGCELLREKLEEARAELEEAKALSVPDVAHTVEFFVAGATVTVWEHGWVVREPQGCGGRILRSGLAEGLSQAMQYAKAALAAEEVPS